MKQHNPLSWFNLDNYKKELTPQDWLIQLAFRSQVYDQIKKKNIVEAEELFLHIKVDGLIKSTMINSFDNKDHLPISYPRSPDYSIDSIRGCLRIEPNSIKKMPPIRFDETFTDLVEALSRPKNGPETIFVNLSYSDKQIIKDFKKWLKNARKMDGRYRTRRSQKGIKKIQDGRFTLKMLDSWSRDKLLEYIDINLWYKINNKKVKIDDICEMVYSDREDGIDRYFIDGKLSLLMRQLLQKESLAKFRYFIETLN